MKELRNWIEEKLGKRTVWTPIYVGMKGGRKLYSISFADGTEADYFIDFDRKEIEEY